MTNLPILVLGVSGQLGRALVLHLQDKCIGLSRSQLDLSNPTELEKAMDRFNVSAVINAAAYTQVDQAEKEGELAWKINGESPGLIARWCSKRNIPFVHFSTDYVFPGYGEQEWTESDFVAPLNSYGRSKAEGEKQIAEAGGRWLVFRTSWVYDSVGKNFLTTMLRLAGEREVLSIVNDQFGAPTYAPQLAEATVVALNRALSIERFPSGIYHLCNGGITTWYNFAEAIFNAAKDKGLNLKVKTVKPTTTSEYPTPAKRPANSRLKTSKIRHVLSVELPDWRVGLAECMEQVYENYTARP
jgi:dTDP-4-dehydrorhamnose reductase